jgi:hypothetical protein
MAMRMAIDLGISDTQAHQPHLSDKERSRRKATWDTILHLHNMHPPAYNDHR